jgi:hypothetical protein
VALTSVLVAEHRGSPRSAALVEEAGSLITGDGWLVAGPDVIPSADAIIGVTDSDLELRVPEQWQHVPSMVLQLDSSPDGGGACLARVWLPGKGAQEGGFRSSGQLETLVRALLAEAERFHAAGVLKRQALFSKALERAESEIADLLELMDELVRSNASLANRLREVEADRNQLRALLEALGHQSGSKTMATAKWIAKAAGTIILSLGSGYAAGVSQARSTPPAMVEVSVQSPEQQQGGLEVQLANALDACLSLEKAAEDTLPPPE